MQKRSLKGNLKRSKRSHKKTRVYEDEVIKLNTLKTRRLVRGIFKVTLQMAFLFTNTNEKPNSDQGVNSGYDLVFGSIRGLYCTWLVPRTRASSHGVDVSYLGEWIHLKRGVDPGGGCGPIGLHGHCIILCGGVQPPNRESRGARN
ncbi:hypothetical protein M9H77_36124 [Catharanthus roseus]|uniref:Uncharacterized protein n=1 Tax=Catharanthus roseus TaxID=4058 RepID=A0ACB9ZQY6_CATRO|nr:hypothetical protein M9H77_36124 [Catharanthus roseus]